MGARTVTVTTCPICDRPLTMTDTAKGWQPQHLLPREAFCVEIGFSRGGWGRRDCGEGVRANFSGEVCRDCFDEAQEVLRPVAEFLHGRPRREEHNVSTVRDHELASGGRSSTLLRALSHFSSGKAD